MGDDAVEVVKRYPLPHFLLSHRPISYAERVGLTSVGGKGVLKAEQLVPCIYFEMLQSAVAAQESISDLVLQEELESIVAWVRV